MESPLAETGPWAEKGPMRKTDMTPPNTFLKFILPNFEKNEIWDDDFGGCPMLPVRKTSAAVELDI